MSDKPIEVGCTVMVVRACCVERVTRVIFKVGTIRRPWQIDETHGVAVCARCGKPVPHEPFAAPDDDPGCEGGQPLSWLKRIDGPPAKGEYDRVAVRETVKATMPIMDLVPVTDGADGEKDWTPRTATWT
jgi:hypothetical protein